MVPTGEGAGEHEDGGFRRVVIRDKGVDQLEFEAGIDKNVVFAFSLASLGVIFQSSCHCCTKSNNPVMSIC